MERCTKKFYISVVNVTERLHDILKKYRKDHDFLYFILMFFLKCAVMCKAHTG